MTYQGIGGGGQQGQRPRKAYTFTITGAANNGSGLIRITSNGHKLRTGDHVTISSVGGCTEANAAWVVTVATANTFDLNNSTFTNAYTSGGTGKRG